MYYKFMYLNYAPCIQITITNIRDQIQKEKQQEKKTFSIAKPYLFS